MWFKPKCTCGAHLTPLEIPHEGPPAVEPMFAPNFTWRMSWAKEPTKCSRAEMEKGVALGFEMISRYFQPSFTKSTAQVVNIFAIMSPWPHPSAGAAAMMWADPKGQWGYRYPAIYINPNHRALATARIIRQVFAHELGHFFVDGSHLANGNIMGANGSTPGNWTQADYAYLKRKMTARPGAPLPWQDTYWTGK